jgi:hypothetical protein
MSVILTREEAQELLNALTYVGDAKDIYSGTTDMLRARLAQPEPEPVAKMREMLEVQGRDGTWDYEPYFHGMYNGMEFMLALAEGRDPVFRKAPEKWLNAPPKRKWQGLTDEEMLDAYAPNRIPDSAYSNMGEDLKKIHDAAKEEMLSGLRAIEAKLKEKNHG